MNRDDFTHLIEADKVRWAQHRHGISGLQIRELLLQSQPVTDCGRHDL